MLELMLKSNAKRAKKNEKGFTLVELIIVVAILGILAAVGISRFAGMTTNARINTDLSAAGTIASAAKAWDADQDNAAPGTPTLTQLKDGGYLEGESFISESTGGAMVLAGTAADGFKVTDDSKNIEWYPKNMTKDFYKDAVK